MKPLLIQVISLVALIVLLSSCSARGEGRLLRQEIALSLDPERHLVAGESTLVFASGSGGSAALDLNGAATIERVSVNGQESGYRRTARGLVVALPGKGAVTVVIRYRCIFNDPAPERAVTTEDPTYGVSGAITSRGTYLGSDSGWYPASDAQPEKRRVTVTAPAGTEAITAGRRLFRRTEGGVTASAWEEEHPVERLSLSAGPYVVEEKSYAGIPLYTYFYPENASLAGRYLDASAEYIRFYAERFGLYPFEKFAVVENFFPTGYGFPSYTLIGGTVIRLPFILNTSLPHEIAHCWWGNGVLVDFRSGNWSEGLATYVADHLMEERKSFRDGRDYRFRMLADYASLVGPGDEFPLREFLGRVDSPSRAIGYGKAAMLFHMVRKRIGDEAFFDALRDIAREKRYAAASWEDFARAFSKRAGSDLSPFMAPWLDQTGGPRLALADVTRTEDGPGWRVTGKVRKEGAYPLSVTVRIEAGGKVYDRTVDLPGGENGFAFTLPASPTRVLLDPEVDLFRILPQAELPTTVNRIKGSRALTLVTGRHCAADAETLRLLLRSLGQGEAMIVREKDASTASLAGRDLLLCGVPERTELLPVLPQESVVASTDFTVGGERFGGEGDALLVVGGRRGEPARVAGLFLPLSPEAARACVLKMTHYGRFGLLVFSKGDNRKKETLPPAGGESVVAF
ncbi:MAG: M1 family peptidase [Desulfuromonadales bacterium]|nr:MAG: M1 family peptidase [Desulfuromonadales bacterium]